MIVDVIHGNSAEILTAMFDDDAVDLVITSPPYDDLRTYNDSSEWSMKIFQEIAHQLGRVIQAGRGNRLERE